MAPSSRWHRGLAWPAWPSLLVELAELGDAGDLSKRAADRRRPFTYAYQAGTNWISGRSNADGSAVINQYDILGRLTQTSAANAAGSVINTYGYSYDAAGQKTQEASSVGTRNFGYDNQRELTGSSNVDANNLPIANAQYNFLYDPIGNLQKKITSAGELDFAVNNVNQYTQLSGTAQPTPLVPTYDADGNMTSDGHGHTYIYDEENRLVEIDNATSMNGVDKTVNVYDGLSRRVEKRTYAGSTLLGTTRYLYDGTVPIAEYDATNTLTRSYTRGLDLSGTRQGAGGIGGLLAMTNAAGQSDSYFYDGNGNVVDLTDAYGALAAHYQYDPFGNLIAQSGSLQQPYQWSSKETDASTGLVSYLYRFYNPALERWQNRDPLAELGSSANYHRNTYATNANLSLQFWKAEFSNYLAVWQPVIAYLLPDEDGPYVTWAFSIYRTEIESAIWLARDPIGENGGINLYGYVGNNPVVYIDPLGLYLRISGDDNFLQTTLDALHDLSTAPVIGPEIMDILNNKNYTVTIKQDNSMNPGDSANPDHVPPCGSTVPWNPLNNINFEHTSKTESPIARLAHELSHADDFINGIPVGLPYMDNQGNSYPAPGEQKAVQAENAGMAAAPGPPGPDDGGYRTTYGGLPVPNPVPTK